MPKGKLLTETPRVQLLKMVKRIGKPFNVLTPEHDLIAIIQEHHRQQALEALRKAEIVAEPEHEIYFDGPWVWRWVIVFRDATFNARIATIGPDVSDHVTIRVLRNFEI